jgi:hypothetical protein
MRLVPMSCVRVCHSIGIAHVCTGVPATKLTDLSFPGCSFTTDPLRSDIAHFFVITLPQTRQTATFAIATSVDFQAPTRAVRPRRRAPSKRADALCDLTVDRDFSAGSALLPPTLPRRRLGYRGANEVSEGRGRAARGRIAGSRPVYGCPHAEARWRRRQRLPPLGVAGHTCRRVSPGAWSP